MHEVSTTNRGSTHGDSDRHERIQGRHDLTTADVEASDRSVYSDFSRSARSNRALLWESTERF